MGLLDDAVPGGKISKPLILALLALVASGALFGGGEREAAPTKPSGPRPAADEGGGPARRFRRSSRTLPAKRARKDNRFLDRHQAERWLIPLTQVRLYVGR